MTDQNDPRNSGGPRREDPEATEVWGRTPDQPTEQYGTVSGQNPNQPTEYFGQQPGAQQYPYGGPDQNTEYLGQQGQQPNPTQAFPAYNPQFDPQAPPPGATQAYPPYTAQRYGTTDQYGNTQQYPVAGGGGGVPPEQPFIEDGSSGGGKKRKLATWVAAGVVGILVAVIAIVAFSAFGSNDKGTQTAFVPPTTTTQAPTTTLPKASTTAPTPTTDSPLSQLPGGLGEVIGDAGGAVGTVKSNDGGTLIIDSIGGSQVTILTTADTTLIALNRATIADLQPGDNIVVDGTPVENGTMTANTILSTSLPKFGN